MSPNFQCSELRPEEIRSGNKTRNSTTFPEDLQLTQACSEAGFSEKCLPGQIFVSIHDIHLAGYGCTSSCREYSHPRNDERSERKGFIRDKTKICLELEQNILTVMEMKTKSLLRKEDGTQS